MIYKPKIKKKMNQELIDAISSLSIDRLGEETDNFVHNVEFETKDEWIAKYKYHIAYQFLIIAYHGDMQSVSDQVEELWYQYYIEPYEEEPEEATQELYPQ